MTKNRVIFYSCALLGVLVVAIACGGPKGGSAAVVGSNQQGSNPVLGNPGGSSEAENSSQNPDPLSPSLSQTSVFGSWAVTRLSCGVNVLNAVTARVLTISQDSASLEVRPRNGSRIVFPLSVNFLENRRMRIAGNGGVSVIRHTGTVEVERNIAQPVTYTYSLNEDGTLTLQSEEEDGLMCRFGGSSRVDFESRPVEESPPRQDIPPHSPVVERPPVSIPRVHIEPRVEARPENEGLGHPESVPPGHVDQHENPLLLRDTDEIPPRSVPPLSNQGNVDPGLGTAVGGLGESLGEGHPLGELPQHQDPSHLNEVPHQEVRDQPNGIGSDPV